MYVYVKSSPLTQKVLTKIISETILILFYLHKGSVVSPKWDLQACKVKYEDDG